MLSWTQGDGHRPSLQLRPLQGRYMCRLCAGSNLYADYERAEWAIAGMIGARPDR